MIPDTHIAYGTWYRMTVSLPVGNSIAVHVRPSSDALHLIIGSRSDSDLTTMVRQGKFTALTKGPLKYSFYDTYRAEQIDPPLSITATIPPNDDPYTLTFNKVAYFQRVQTDSAYILPDGEFVTGWTNTVQTMFQLQVFLTGIAGGSPDPLNDNGYYAVGGAEICFDNFDVYNNPCWTPYGDMKITSVHAHTVDIQPQP